MKILFIHSLFFPYIAGGAEISVLHLCQGLVKKGHQVNVLSLCSERGKRVEKIFGISVFRLGLRNIYWPFNKHKKNIFTRSIWHLIDIFNPVISYESNKVIQEISPDVVSVHNLSGFSVSIWPMLKRKKWPFVQVLHDLYNLCPNSNMFSGEQSCQRRCLACSFFRFPHYFLSQMVPGVVGVSKFVLEKHLSFGFFSKAKIKAVIKNCRNLPFIEANFEKQSKKPINFGFIGTLAPSKGVEFLCQEFSKIKGQEKLFIAGSGENVFEEKIKSIYSANNIQFLGYCDPKNFFKKIDVLIVPSLWNDTLPGVVFEAFAYGVPVIGSNLGGIPEMVFHGKNGLIFDPQIPGDLVKKIVYIIENTEKIQEFKQFIKEDVRQYLDLNKWIDAWETVYFQTAEVFR